MADAAWQFVPKKGIKRGEVELFFGMSRDVLRAQLHPLFGAPVTNFPDEDDFESKSDGTFIRLRYGQDGLQDVEFLGGDLELDGLELYRDATWEALEPELLRRGFEFDDASVLGDGLECAALGVNIATHDDAGGDGDGIEWVITSVNIR